MLRDGSGVHLPLDFCPKISYIIIKEVQMNLPKPKEEHMAAIRALREVPSHSLRKGMKIFSKQLVTPVTGIIMDDYRKRSTRLI